MMHIWDNFLTSDTAIPNNLRINLSKIYHAVKNMAYIFNHNFLLYSQVKAL